MNKDMLLVLLDYSEEIILVLDGVRVNKIFNE